MSAAPFDVGLIQARLSAQVPTLRTVGMAADYAAVRSLADFATPCAYIVLANERGIPHPPGHSPRGQQVKLRQIARATFGVVLAVRNYREQRGEQLVDELAAMLGATRLALIGFVPDLDGARPCEFVAGDLQDYDASTALWVDVYQTQHSIGNQQVS